MIEYAYSHGKFVFKGDVSNYVPINSLFIWKNIQFYDISGTSFAKEKTEICLWLSFYFNRESI